MYLSLTPLLLASILAFFMDATSIITEGSVESKQAFISLVALETNPIIASVAFLLPRNTFVRSVVLLVLFSLLQLRLSNLNSLLSQISIQYSIQLWT